MLIALSVLIGSLLIGAVTYLIHREYIKNKEMKEVKFREKLLMRRTGISGRSGGIVNEEFRHDSESEKNTSFIFLSPTPTSEISVWYTLHIFLYVCTYIFSISFVIRTFFLWYHRMILSVSMKWLGYWTYIGQCDSQHFMMLPIKSIVSYLNSSTYIISSIITCFISLSEILL